MVLNEKEIKKILNSNNLEKDKFNLIKYADEIMEFSKKTGNILNRNNIIDIISRLKTENKISKRTYIPTFIRYTVDILGMFSEITIFDEKNGTNLKRYISTDVKISPYEIALSLVSNSFLSHYSALVMNDLTINSPKDIYVSQELRKTKTNTKYPIFSQSKIDYAFSKKMRTTNNNFYFHYKGISYRVHVLNSVNYNRMGIILKEPIGFSKKIFITDIERTLIDIVVRPKYSGGISQIIDSYSRSKGIASIEKIFNYLDQFNFYYPYYKSILFYLKYVGYPSQKLRKYIERYQSDERNELIFYLDYQIMNKKLDEQIGIYIPGSLQINSES